MSMFFGVDRYDGLRTLNWLAGVVAAVCVIWLLRAAAVVAMPLAAAFFVALVLHPARRALEARLPRHRWVAVPLTMLLLVGTLGGVIWATAEAVDEAVETAPQYADRVKTLWHQWQEQGRQAGLPIPSHVSATDAQQQLTAFAATVVRTVWEVVSGLVLVLFLVLLMLLESPVWRENLPHTLRGGVGGTTLDAVRAVAAKVRRYLYVRTLLGLMSAGAAAVWLLVLDIDLVLVWVVLTFALNYIPNLGSIVAVLPPTAMALVQHGPVHAAITLAGLAAIEQFIGNYLDPRMQGRRLHVSPTMVLVSLVFWTWVWGPVGALLAVPMTVTLLAAAAHTPALAPLATLLSAERDSGSA